MMTENQCPICNGASHAYGQLKGLPVHSVRLVHSLNEAQSLTRADFDLHQCSKCGFAWNSTFEPHRLEYDAQYEETQGYSSTFKEYQQGLAKHLVSSYDLTDQAVLEVGCGKGEFLVELLDQNVAEAVGVDPSLDADRLPQDPRLHLIQQYFPVELPQSITPTAVICLMTLEHLASPADFMREIRQQFPGATLMLTVPSLESIVERGAFWDIYYEHVNYFSGLSLQALAQGLGDEVLELRRVFSGQYWLMVSRAQKSMDAIQPPQNAPSAPDLGQSLDTALAPIAMQLDSGDVLIWGAASKAVALFHRLPELAKRASLCDINPVKSNTFLPGTELLIRAPDAFTNRRFDKIVIANPVYENEIRAQLSALNIRGEVVLLGI